MMERYWWCKRLDVGIDMRVIKARKVDIKLAVIFRAIVGWIIGSAKYLVIVGIASGLVVEVGQLDIGICLT